MVPRRDVERDWIINEMIDFRSAIDTYYSLSCSFARINRSCT